jgi:hypothetical protein
MALDLVDVVEALGARIRTAIPGTEVYDVLQDNPAVPCVIVGMPTTVDPHWTVGTMGGGALTRMELPVLALACRVDPASGYQVLSDFLSPSNATGVPVAVETPPGTLGVERVASVLVTAIGDFGEYTYAGVSYLGAVMTVEVTG